MIFQYHIARTTSSAPVYGSGNGAGGFSKGPARIERKAGGLGGQGDAGEISELQQGKQEAEGKDPENQAKHLVDPKKGGRGLEWARVRKGRHQNSSWGAGGKGEVSGKSGKTTGGSGNGAGGFDKGPARAEREAGGLGRPWCRKGGIRAPAGEAGGRGERIRKNRQNTRRIRRLC
jgi:hypothetical protein